MKKKLHSQSGFTLTELLTAMMVLGLLTLAMAAGMSTAARVYRTVTLDAEAAVLCGTLSSAIEDELRYAQDPNAGGQFDSHTYGRKVSVQTKDGRIEIGGYPLLSEKAYTSALTAEAEVSYAPETGLFSVVVTVLDDGRPAARSEFVTRALNQ